jgi:O-antigen/teichoic acid export membrane protein
VSATSRVVTLGLQTLQFALAARLVDEVTFGALAAAMALWFVVGGLAEFGLLNTSILEYRQSEERHAARSSAAANLMLVGAASVVGVVVGLVLLQGTSRLAMLLLLPWFVVSRLRLVNLARHQYHFRVRRLAVVELGSRLVLVALTLPLFLVRGSWTENEMIAAIAFVMLVGEIVAFVGLTIGHGDSYWPIQGYPWFAGRRMIREAAPLGLTNASSMVHAKSDQILLDMLGRQASVAVYAVAYRINDAFLALAISIGVVTFPALVRAERPQRTELARFLLAATAAAAAAGGLVVFVFAPALLTIVGGRSYTSGADIARLLAPALVVSVANLVVAQVAIVEGRARTLLVTSLLFAGANIALNLVLIPFMGPEGAAVATVVTETVGFVVVALVARQALPGSAPFWYIVLPVAGFWLASFGSLAIWDHDQEAAAVVVALVGLGVAGLPLLVELLRRGQGVSGTPSVRLEP